MGGETVRYIAIRHAGLVVSGVLIAALATGVSANAQTVEEFYRGKQVRVVVASDTGAGFDTYARILGNFMGNFIPGNPTFIVQNMPGAGGISASSYVYHQAAKDGLTLGALHRTTAQAPLVGVPGADFDTRKFYWIGSLNNEVGVCVSWHESRVKKFEDLFEHELIVGSSTGGDGDTYPQIMNRIMGTKFKAVTGYKGGAQVLIALERREVDGRCSWSWSSIVVQRMDWVKDKKINILAQLSVEKHPDLQHVPQVIEFAKDEEQRKALRFLFARGVIGRPYVAPPGVPLDRIAALRKAFDEMVKAPEVIAEFERQKQELTPVSGVKIQSLIEEFYATPKSLIEIVK